MKALLNKMSPLILLQNQFEGLRLLLIAFLTWLVLFIKPIIGKTYTSWDTHDIGFVNFLYFSDSLRLGIFPFWNHFIQSGTFHPSLNNAGLFSPFQLLFVSLSWVISPVYAYELMIQTVVIIGGVGSYLLYRTYTNDRLIALMGATAFVAAVMVPIVGQIVILTSLSSVPWIIFACIKIMKSRDLEVLRYLILGTLGALYIASGYLWMNLVHLIIVAIFLFFISVNKYLFADIQEKKIFVTTLINFMLFFGAATFLYACIELPGYLSMHSNYDLFIGDFESPEPRLRGLNLGEHGQFFSYGSIYDALIAAIDPRITSFGNMWSLGAGWVLWTLFLVIPAKVPFSKQLFWFVLMIFALMYSAGNSNFVGDLVRNIPIINANRWWFIGTFYVSIFLISLVVVKLSLLHESYVNHKKHHFRVLLVGLLSLSLLVYFKSSMFEVAMVITSLTLVWLLGRAPNRAKWDNLLIALIAINVFSMVSMPYTGIKWPARYLRVTDYGGYEDNVISREKNVVITQNFRQLGDGHDYIYNNQQWLLKKIPFSHGYNNLGNPYYWYVKNDPFLKRLVVVTQYVRQERSIERSSFSNDNQFAEAIMGDVLADMARPTIEATHFNNLSQSNNFKWQLDELKIEPNIAKMKVTTNSAAYLIFNNVDHPGWKAFVNGKKANLIKTNRIFQGVFLQGAGTYEVVFKFRPVLTISLILLPYIVLLLCFIAYIRRARARG